MEGADTAPRWHGLAGSRDERKANGGGEELMIGNGSVLMRESSPRPACVALEAGPSRQGWREVEPRLKARALEQALATEGWTFLYLASELTGGALGRDRERMTEAALGRVIRKAEEMRCNSVQVDRVEEYSLLGMKYVRVEAHPRHLQEGARRVGAKMGRR